MLSPFYGGSEANWLDQCHTNNIWQTGVPSEVLIDHLLPSPWWN